MQKNIFSLWLKLIVLLTAFLSSGCSASKESEGNISVEGGKHNYTIPSEYIKNLDSDLHAGVEGADKSASTALLIPDVVSSGVQKSFSLYLLLFHDKAYKQETVLREASKAILKRSEKMPNVENLYRYRETIGDSVESHYFNFDPSSSKPRNVSKTDFHARLKNIPGLDIEGVTTVPKPSCQIYSVYDEILIQATVVDDACSPKNLANIKVLQDDLMTGWRVD